MSIQVHCSSSRGKGLHCWAGLATQARPQRSRHILHRSTQSDCLLLRSISPRPSLPGPLPGILVGRILELSRQLCVHQRQCSRGCNCIDGVALGSFAAAAVGPHWLLLLLLLQGWTPQAACPHKHGCQGPSARCEAAAVATLLSEGASACVRIRGAAGVATGLPALAAAPELDGSGPGSAFCGWDVADAWSGTAA